MKIKECVMMMRTCNALFDRLTSLKKLVSSDSKKHFKSATEKELSFPMDLRILGFPKFKCQSREELLGRIAELEDLLCLDIEEITYADEVKKDGG